MKLSTGKTITLLIVLLIYSPVIYQLITYGFKFLQEDNVTGIIANYSIFLIVLTATIGLIILLLTTLYLLSELLKFIKKNW